MTARRRRAVGKWTLFIYVFISATFNFSHRDYVPLASTLVISRSHALDRYLDRNGGEFVCPAHLFAQSTTANEVRSQDFSSPKHFSFLRFLDRPQYLVRPQLTASSRAPPLP